MTKKQIVEFMHNEVAYKETELKAIIEFKHTESLQIQIKWDTRKGVLNCLEKKRDYGNTLCKYSRIKISIMFLCNKKSTFPELLRFKKCTLVRDQGLEPWTP